MALALTAALLTPGAAQAADRPELRRELDGMVAAGVPGVTLTVQHGEQVHRANAGVADLDTGAPLPVNGRFRIASLSKTMVATALLQLVDADRLTLSDPIARHLPGLLPGGEQITVRQLLHNTSGLADYLDDPQFADPAAYVQRHFTPAQLIATANALGHRPPGGWKYSNTNYLVLGLLIEQITGEDLANRLRRTVFRPARMFAAELPAHRRLRGPHASGHYWIAPGARTELTHLDPSFAWAAYGIVSTAEDLRRFHTALFGGRLLSAELTERMRTEAVATVNPVWPRYGLGIEEMATTCGVKLWGHTGAIPATPPCSSPPPTPSARSCCPVRCSARVTAGRCCTWCT